MAKYEIGFYTKDYDAPEHVELNIDSQMLNRIIYLDGLVRQNDDIYRLSIEILDFELYDRKGEEYEYHHDTALLYIFGTGSLYFYAQNEDDSSNQIESKAIKIDEIVPED